jgi:hypothetical protein
MRKQPDRLTMRVPRGKVVRVISWKNFPTRYREMLPRNPPDPIRSKEPHIPAEIFYVMKGKINVFLG